MPVLAANPQSTEVLAATTSQPCNDHAGVHQEGLAQGMHVEELPQLLQQGREPGSSHKGLLGAGTEPALQGVMQAQRAGDLIWHGKEPGRQCQRSVKQSLRSFKEPASIRQAPAPALGSSASPEVDAPTTRTLAHPTRKRPLLPLQPDRPTRKPIHAAPAAGAALVGKRPATATPRRPLTPRGRDEPAALLPGSDPTPVAAAAPLANAVQGWLDADMQVDSPRLGLAMLSSVVRTAASLPGQNTCRNCVA